MEFRRTARDGMERYLFDAAVMGMASEMVQPTILLHDLSRRVSVSGYDILPQS